MHFKNIFKFLRHLSSRLHSTQTTVTPRATTNEEIKSAYSSNRIPTPSSSIYDLEPPFASSAMDLYLQNYDSDWEFASIADLCSQLGNQLPLHLVKLAAKDVLRSLIDIHKKGKPYRDMNKRTILLSPHDLKALVSQGSGDTQSSTSLTDPSEPKFQLSVQYPFYDQRSRCYYSSSLNTSGDIRPRLHYVSCPSDAPVFRLRLSSLNEGSTSTQPQVSDSIHHQSQALQPPEHLLHAPASPKADMWTLGCLLFELTGDSLFDPIFQTDELDISPEESHIIQMIELLGDVPLSLIREGKSSGKWFTEDGLFRIETMYYPVSFSSILERHVEKNELEGTVQFLEMLLRLNPEERPRAEDVIDHEWFNS